MNVMTERKTEVSEQLAAMEHIVENNLRECCKDIEQWHNIGVLPPNTLIRVAAEKLTDLVFSGTQLVHVENCVNRLARKTVIALDKF